MEEKYYELIKDAKELKEFCNMNECCEGCIFFNDTLNVYADKCNLGYPNEWGDLEKLKKTIFEG